MIWSISGFKTFVRCPRRWFYDEKVASRSMKDPYRHKVYLLSQLETIDAWRGKIVDYVISEFIIPKLRRKQQIKETEVIDFARSITRTRYDFAKQMRYKEVGLKKTEHEKDYAALSEFEFEEPSEYINQRLKIAWQEIELALKNFLNNTSLINDLYEADYLVTQRSLTYKIHGYTIRGVPDIISFYKNKPPKIRDWKVHHWGTKTYNDQLLIYAVSLASCEPHKDFLQYHSNYSVEDILLAEYQLLKNTVREYFITAGEIERINDYIADGLHSMERQECHKEYKDLSIEDFSQTSNLDNCRTCPYKRLCQEN